VRRRWSTGLGGKEIRRGKRKKVKRFTHSGKRRKKGKKDFLHFVGRGEDKGGKHGRYDPSRGVTGSELNPFLGEKGGEKNLPFLNEAREPRCDSGGKGKRKKQVVVLTDQGKGGGKKRGGDISTSFGVG